MRGIRLYATLAAMFMAGAFLASPELRAYAANTILSTDIKDGEVKTPDIANNAVTAAKIKDGEVKTDDIAPSAIGSLRIKDNDVKAQDLAPDSVGGSEIQGVTKLIFASCTFSYGTIAAGSQYNNNCSAPGLAEGDQVIATANGPVSQYWHYSAEVLDNGSGAKIFVVARNDAPFPLGPAEHNWSFIIFR